MNGKEQIKDIIQITNHINTYIMKESYKKILLLVASLLTALGLAEWAGIVNYIGENVEIVFTAINTVIAVVTALFVKVKKAINDDEEENIDPILN